MLQYLLNCVYYIPSHLIMNNTYSSSKTHAPLFYPVPKNLSSQSALPPLIITDKTHSSTTYFECNEKCRAVDYKLVGLGV